MIEPHLLGQLAGILVMSMLCDHGVDVYGFDTGNEPPDTPYHYYDEGVPNSRAMARPICPTATTKYESVRRGMKMRRMLGMSPALR